MTLFPDGERASAWAMRGRNPRNPAIVAWAGAASGFGRAGRVL